jgi:branched-chain amino acid transport system ATP-binding protein
MTTVGHAPAAATAQPEPSGRNRAPMAMFALAILTAIFFFDEFDTAAFGVLAPNIEKAFGLTDKQFGLIVIGNVSIVLALSIPISHFADRLPRSKLVVLCGLIAGIFSFFTGVVGSVLFLVLVRLGNGIGVVANNPIHNSLLADYFPAEERPRSYAVHQNALFLGAIVGPAFAGGLASLFDWRAAFIALIFPTVGAAILALRLKEPQRGGTDDPDAAAEAQAEEPVKFSEAMRTLLAVPTLYRQYIANLFIGAGVIPLSFVLPLYLQRVYGVEPLGRGIIGAGNAAAQFAGVIVAGILTRRWLAKDSGEPLKYAGYALGLVGFGLLGVALAPTLPVSIVVGLVTSFFGGAFYPPFYTVQSMVSPARVRTLSFGFGSLFLVAGVVLIWVIGVGTFWPAANLSAKGNHQDYRLALGALLPWWLIGGATLASAKRFVARDADRALRTLATTVEMRRRRREAGAQALLLVSKLDVAYDKVQVLFNVDLEIDEGEIVALLGTNGAGKSTLLKAISGLVDPAGGAIFFEGRDVTHLDPMTSTELGIVQMPGGRSVFPTLTVNECLRLAGWLYRKNDAEHVKAATVRARELFPILESRGDQLAGNLSGGEQQMLGLAMALISKPRLLMIDELSLGLAPTIVGQLVDVVREIHEQGTTIVIVEQSVNVALTLAQRAVFMEKGEVRFSGPTADLLARDDILRSVFLEGAAKAGIAPEASIPAPTPPRGSNGVTAARAEQRRPPIPADAPVLLSLDDVVVRFGGVQAVDHASFQLREGEVLGLIGPNGAGKTTIFDTISGFVRPQHGWIRFQDQDITPWSPDRRALAGLGRSFQDARLFPSMTVVENIATAFERHIAVRDPVAAALGLPAVADSESDVAWQVNDLVEVLGLDAFRNKYVSELSTGSRRIVDIAMSIAHKPSVLILDEPSSGIAQRETEALGPLLLRIKEQLGCALLVIEHDMPLITSISDTMIALELGAVIATGTPQEVVRHPRVVASYLGTNEAAINRSGDTAAAAPPRARRPRASTATKDRP